MNPHFFTAPFYFAFIWFRVQGPEFKVQGSRFRVQGSGGGFAANIPMTIHAACNGTPTFRKANPASLHSSAPSRGRGANDFSGNTDYIVAIRGQGLTLPHICRALLRFPHLSFMPPVPYPPLRGTFP